MLESHEQEQVIQNFTARLEEQRKTWKQVFLGVSIVLSIGVVFSFTTDLSWYPAFLDRTTYGHTPSSSLALSLTVTCALSLVCTGINFFSSAPRRNALLLVCFNFLISLLISVVTASKSLSLLLPVAYQCICSLALYTLHDTDNDLRALKKHKYNYKTA